MSLAPPIFDGLYNLSMVMTGGWFMTLLYPHYEKISTAVYFEFGAKAGSPGFGSCDSQQSRMAHAALYHVATTSCLGWTGEIVWLVS